jgi:hypothetical protein
MVKVFLGLRHEGTSSLAEKKTVQFCSFSRGLVSTSLHIYKVHIVIPAQGLKFLISQFYLYEKIYICYFFILSALPGNGTRSAND